MTTDYMAAAVAHFRCLKAGECLGCMAVSIVYIWDQAAEADFDFH